MTASLASLPLSLITATAALLASILGPLVTLSVARHQFRANVIANNRHRRIETFRDHLSELLSLINAAQVIKRHTAGRWREGLADNPALGEKLERAFMAMAEIRLLTSPGAPEHRRLNEHLAAALAHLQSDELRETELAACVEEVMALGRNIIRHEWGRVKRGE
jgi:hypothetical protein